MSLSEYSSASFSKTGYARKLVSVRLSDTLDGQEPPLKQSAILQLRDTFARRADVTDRDSILSTIERYLGGEGADSAGREIVRAPLTRKHRKIARNLGFEVRYQGG